MDGSDRQLDPHKVVDDVDYIINYQLKNNTNKKVDRRMAGYKLVAGIPHCNISLHNFQYTPQSES